MPDNAPKLQHLSAEFRHLRFLLLELLEQCKKRKDLLEEERVPFFLGEPVPGINWLPYIVLSKIIRGGPPSEHFDLGGTTPQPVHDPHGIGRDL